MVRNDRYTMFINMKHVFKLFNDLADLMISSYYRYEAYLLKGLEEFMKKYHSRVEEEEENLSYHLSFYSLPTMNKMRDLRTNSIGVLSCMSGTVTRSTEVRPELLVGAFECGVCGSVVKGVK